MKKSPCSLYGTLMVHLYDTKKERNENIENVAKMKELWHKSIQKEKISLSTISVHGNYDIDTVRERSWLWHLNKG